MPGSPNDGSHIEHSRRALHPLAWIFSLVLVAAGLAMTRSWIALAIAAVLLCAAALRAERKSLAGEMPLLGLAVIVFLAHVLSAWSGWRGAIGPSAVVAFRLLALLYLLRAAARVALGPIARWLMGRKPPSRPRVLTLLLESARLTAGILPLALREAEQHVTALRGRGIRPGRGLRGIARYLIAWFLPFLGTMLRVGDAYADALIVRGYAPGRARRTGLRPAWGWPEWGVLAGSAGTCAWLVRGL